MKAITYQAQGIVQIKELPDPEPGAGEVVIQVHASGICHTDIDILYGRYGSSTFPLVPGHEYAGEVIATGDQVTRFKVGDRVVVDPNFHCGSCRACQKGLTNLCDTLGAYGVTRHGGFAEYSVVHQDNVISIAGLPYPIAALAEPVGCVLNGLDAIETSSVDNAMIFGAGPIGTLMALALRTRGVDDIAMVDIDESRLELAESFGLTPVAAGSENLESRVRSVDLVADATGVPRVAEKLIDYTANGGSILFFGVCPPGETIRVSPHEIFRRQIRLAGTHSLNHNIPAALQAIEQIGTDINRLISHRVGLDEIKSFLEKSGQQSSLKVQATFS
ncbi:zinc-binding dehydrogenase [Chromatiales bacterium (ex Bugula neritina AB1)]|nr:zinc-binding dehydrogenase [Chromatiales bacterium (ex Bugula neritina AB1)]